MAEITIPSTIKHLHDDDFTNKEKQCWLPCNITTDVWVAINKIPLKGTYINIQMTGWIIIDSLY